METELSTFVKPTDIKENETLWKVLYDESPIGIVFIEKGGRITNANRSFCEMLDYSKDEIIEKTMYELTHPDDLEIHLKGYKKTLAGLSENFNFQKRYLRKDGSVLWGIASSALIKDVNGMTRSTLAMIQDYSNIREAQKILNEKVNELAKKNLELKKYIDSNIELESFAYIVSHDLREPLRTIGNFTQLLQRRLKDKLDDNEKEFMEFVINGVRNMDALIDDLLTFSRITAMQPEYEAINILNVLILIKNNLHKTILENHASIEIDELPEIVTGNPTGISQLFQNLISNAIKFRKKEEKPIVQISGVEKENFYQFVVKDNGIGIDEEYSERIFQLFRKLHSKHEFPGSGIGLALCKKVVEQHEGKLWFDSKPGNGTTFYFTIKKF